MRAGPSSRMRIKKKNLGNRHQLDSPFTRYKAATIPALACTSTTAPLRSLPASFALPFPAPCLGRDPAWLATFSVTDACESSDRVSDGSAPPATPPSRRSNRSDCPGEEAGLSAL